MPPDLQELRQQLRERFPEAHQSTNSPVPLRNSSGLPDFPVGALTELAPTGPASGLSLILADLLSEPPNPNQEGSSPEHQTALTARSLGLIDGCDSFDPASYGPALCSRLLWVRCRQTEESLHCTDLLLRDGNLPLLVLDLQLNPLSELRKIPASSWYRLRNLAKQSGSSLLVFTPRHLVPCAALQLTFDSAFSLADLEKPRTELSPALSPNNHRAASY